MASSQQDLQEIVFAIQENPSLVYEDILIVTMCIMSACTLVVYDYFITFKDEVELIWRRQKWSGPKLIFLLQRYYGMAHLGAVVAGITNVNVTASFCTGWDSFMAFGLMFEVFMTNYLLILRVVALFDGNFIVKTVLGVMYLGSFVVNVAIPPSVSRSGPFIAYFSLYMVSRISSYYYHVFVNSVEDPNAVGPSTGKLFQNYERYSQRRHCVFCCDSGGDDIRPVVGLCSFADQHVYYHRDSTTGNARDLHSCWQSSLAQHSRDNIILLCSIRFASQ